MTKENLNPKLNPLVRIVDDDERVRQSEAFVLRLSGWDVKEYESAERFLESDDKERCGCLVLDIRMPGLSGIELQKELIRQGRTIPILFLTGHGDLDMAVAALKRGYASGACWAMNNAALYNLFYSMVDSNGRPIFIADPKAEGIGKILGFPVVVDDYLPAETILFGNFNYMGYNLPEGITIEASRESSFKSGRIDYRAMAVADCKPIVEEAFIKLTRSAT